MSWHVFVKAEDLLEHDYLPESEWKHYCLDLTAASQKEPTPPPTPEREGPSEYERRRKSPDPDHQSAILAVLRTEPDGLTLMEISRDIGLCRTSTNIAALALHGSGFITRRKEPVQAGGYRYRYFFAKEGA